MIRGVFVFLLPAFAHVAFRTYPIESSRFLVENAWLIAFRPISTVLWTHFSEGSNFPVQGLYGSGYAGLG